MLKNFDPPVPNLGSERSAIFRQLRDYQPVCDDEPSQTPLLSRFADVLAAATDPATFSSVTTDASTLLPILNQLDDPGHGKRARGAAHTIALAVGVRLRKGDASTTGLSKRTAR